MGELFAKSITSYIKSALARIGHDNVSLNDTGAASAGLLRRRRARMVG
jgi:hypothetical protein